ncbi:MAG: sulfurtransferase-like selenium metabolism protein YedF [Bacteroidetes bacterium]|nr:sulfurtransferase-like selenium metabolism protein YedF [Bacteroidota bacterium]
MQVVDGKGLLCPQPLILTRKALKKCLPGETLKIECDNRTAYQNILTYLNDQSLAPQGTEAGGIFHIEVINEAAQSGEKTAPGNIDPGVCSSAYVVVVNSDKMGEGDPQLGTILMKGFLNALHEQPVLPTHLIFYNSGVKLTTVDSGVSSSLKALEESGVEIMICGTCVDFYRIKEELAVGKISNMFTITETMAKTGHVIQP